jgi:DNA-binding IclR family transcriptional regulator
MARLVQYLELRPGEQFTVGWLAVETGLPRQSCTVALEGLRAAGLVEQGYDTASQLTTWYWIVQTEEAPEANLETQIRARPRPRRPPNADDVQYREFLLRDGWDPGD